MSLVDYISGLITGPTRGAPESSTASVCREPSTPNPEMGDGVAFDGGPPYVYECRRCGTTVNAETTVCPRCDRDTIAEYPVR